MGAKDIVLIGLIVISIALLAIQIPRTNAYLQNCTGTCGINGQVTYMGILLAIAVISAIVLLVLSKSGETNFSAY